MSETMALAVLTLLGGYFGTGLLFAIPFLAIGLPRVDASATSSRIGFRLLILPGVMLFWPLLARRWWRGGGMPPDERSPHLCGSRSHRP